MSDETLTAVRQRRAELAKLRKEIEAEDSDLEITERTLKRLLATKPNGAEPKTTRIRRTRRIGSASGEISQKDLIIATLKTTEDPWVETADGLREMVMTTHGVDIPKTSFQPLISIMKRDKIIKRDGQRVALAERLR